MYQVKVKIVGLEVTQSLVESFFDVVRVVMGVPELAGDLFITVIAISDLEILRCLQNSSNNIRRSLRGAHPTSSNHFLLRFHFGSMLPRQYDGNPCEEQPRLHFRLREAWRAMAHVVLSSRVRSWGE